MNASTWIKVAFAGLLLTGAGRADAAQMGRVCDVTRNGTVTTFDAVRVLKFVAGIGNFTPGEQLLADASGNGTITAYDAALIMAAAHGTVVSGSLCGALVRMP